MASEQEMREQLDELQYKYRILQTLSASMSMEFRTPITALQGYSEILLQGIYGEPNEQQIECINAIKFNAEALLTMFNQFYDVHRALLGQLILDFQEIDIEELLEPIKPDNLTLKIPKEVPKIWVDPRHLIQAFEGLFSATITGWDEAEASLQVDYSDEWMNFKIISTRDASYIGSREYTNPMLTFSEIVIEKHGGEYQLAGSEEGLEITFSLPIFHNESSL